MEAESVGGDEGGHRLRAYDPRVEPDELLYRLRLRGVLTEFDGEAADRLVAEGHALRRGTRLAPTFEGRAAAELGA